MSRLSGGLAPLFHGKAPGFDGDEDAIIFRGRFAELQSRNSSANGGGQMDAPLVLTATNPTEVDKEALNVDSGWFYERDFYEATLNQPHPKCRAWILLNDGWRTSPPCDYGYTPVFALVGRTLGTKLWKPYRQSERATRSWHRLQTSMSGWPLAWFAPTSFPTSEVTSTPTDGRRYAASNAGIHTGGCRYQGVAFRPRKKREEAFPGWVLKNPRAVFATATLR